MSERPPLKDRPDLLYCVKLDLDRFIVGEVKNKLLLWEICETAFDKHPVHAFVVGESAAGKSHLVNNITKKYHAGRFYSFSRITKAGLDRFGGDLSHKILVVQEMAGMDKATDTIRIMLSEGKLELLTSTTDAKGHLEDNSIILKTVGMPVFITTTTNVQIESET